MAKRFLMIAILATFVLPGCSGKKAELETVVLQPSQVATAVKRNWHKHEDPGINCAAKRDVHCRVRYDVLPDASGDSPIAVGLWHDYGEKYVLGVGCWERINCLYRGLVLFDLTPIS